MKTAIINSVKNVEIIDTPMPTPKSNEALLKLVCGGICGSDLGTYRGTFAYSSFPRIPGHEFAAVIENLPENNLGLKKGMLVTCNPYFNCGHCYSCERGFVNCCEHNETLGAQRDGAFSEYISMPLERIYDGKGLAPNLLTLIEPFCISYHGAVTRGKVTKGEKVLVIGAGTIGVLAAISAKSMGAEVYISDVAQNKLDYAINNFDIDGAILNTSNEEFLEKSQQITNGKGFDVAIEAVGLPNTFKACIDAVAFAGRVVVIGIGKQKLDFDYTVIQKKEINVLGSRNALKQDFLFLIDLVKDNKIKNIEKVITNTFSFKHIKDAFNEMDINGKNNLKIQLNF